MTDLVLDNDLTEDEEKMMMAGEGETPEPTPEPEPKEEPAPEPEAKVEPEPKADEPKDEPKDEAKEKKTVPLEALHEARSEIKQYRQELKERDARMDTIKQDFLELKKSLQQPKEPEVPAPDYNEDPLGAVRHQTTETHKTVEQQRQELEQVKQQQEFANFTNQIARIEQNFAATEKPDYYEAHKYFNEVRGKQLQSMGYQESEINQMIGMDNYGISSKAVGSGMNPAEVMYNQAVLLGYQPPSAEAAPEPEPEAKPNTVDTHLETVAKGQEKAAKKGSGGDTPEHEITMKELLAMDEESPEFDAAFDKLFKGS
jgi:hypothetical protein